MKQEKVAVQTQDGPMNLHVFYPENSGKGPIPAVIVLQEAFGVNQHIVDICQRMAGEGYLAVAPELFHRVADDLELTHGDMPKVMAVLGALENEELADDVKAAYYYLKNLKNVSISSIGTAGFCMGGFTSILGACRLPLNFAISCYGGGLSNERPGIGFKPFMNEFKKIQCPMFLLYGEKDQSIAPDQIEEVRGQLKRAEKEYEIKIYIGAGHAFLREGSPSHDAAASIEAWKDIFNWLKLHAHSKT